jgi:hypothetical protein
MHQGILPIFGTLPGGSLFLQMDIRKVQPIQGAATHKTNNFINHRRAKIVNLRETCAPSPAAAIDNIDIKNPQAHTAMSPINPNFK